MLVLGVWVLYCMMVLMRPHESSPHALPPGCWLVWLQGELMEGDNAYHVEHLGKRVAAVKRTAIKDMPQMLCIHLKRFEFDYHNQTRYKVWWPMTRCWYLCNGACGRALPVLPGL